MFIDNWIRKTLEGVSEKTRQDVAYAYSGSCQAPNLDYWGITEDQAEAILILYDVNQCVVCGWWLYEGDYCTEHDHDEIVCTDCCED